MKLFRFCPEEFSEITLKGMGISPLQAADLQAHHCDEHWQLASPEGQIKAQLSLWWNEVPLYPDRRLGVIGHFAADSPDSCKTILDQACQRLHEIGCNLAIGPMNGNTWRKYRFVNGGSNEPPFFMEPQNPAEWSNWWTANRFEPLAQYTSSVVQNLDRIDPRIERVQQRLDNGGVIIRNMDVERFDDELHGIYEVSKVSFAHNFLYTPLSESDFVGLYEPIRQIIRPDCVFIAEHNGKTVGYMFSVPDFAQAQAGRHIDTLIGKTLAVLPGKIYGGLGVVLVDQLHKRAKELGFHRVLHALQHTGNTRVRNLTEFYGEIMRHYTLYARAL